jgi:pentapeptide MXKDX repeat protein
MAAIPPSGNLWRVEPMTTSRFLLPLAAATVSLGLAFAPAALAQGMSKDNMSQDNMSKDHMSRDKMEKSSMSKSHKGMKKDAMDEKKDKMSDGMKK